MADKKISQLPLGALAFNSIFPVVTNEVTSQISFTQILEVIKTATAVVSGVTYNPTAGITTFYFNDDSTVDVTGYFTSTDDIYVTGGTYNDITGIATFINKAGSTFNVNGFFTGFTYTPEDTANKQNSMIYDGSGFKYPTVDTVNELTNNIAKATISTGFIDPTDSFLMRRVDDFTLGITASTKGIFYKSLLKTPDFGPEPSAAILNIPDTTIDLTAIPLSGLGISGDGIYVKFIGFDDSSNFIYSNTTFKRSDSTAQLGILILKVVSGITSFEDANRNVINIPSICSYSNLELTMLGLQSNVIVVPNSGMSITNTNGSIKGMSVNWHGANNDEKAIASSSATSFTHLSYANALSIIPPSFTTAVTTTQYWDNNLQTLVNLSTATAATIQRWIVTVNGTLALQYGEREYTSLQEAINSISIATFLDVLPVDTYTEITRMAAISGTTGLSNTSQVVFRTTAGGGGGGGATNATVWGTINGNINDQTDLFNRLNSKIDKTGTTNTIPKFTSVSGLTNSNISDNGSAVTITTDAIIVNASIGRANTVDNLIFGAGALGTSNTTASTLNVAIGDFTLNSNTSGSSNVAVGYSSLFSNKNGTDNTAIGTYSMYSNTGGTVQTDGSYNTAVGSNSLALNTTGGLNMAFGAYALYFNTTGFQNAAIGYLSLYTNTTGHDNTGVGNGTLQNVTTGNFNTAVGSLSMGNGNPITGQNNIGIGFQSGRQLTSGSRNILIEITTGGGVTTGNNNIIINPVSAAGISTASGNTVIGGFAGTIPNTSNGVYIGTGAGTMRMSFDSAGTMTLTSTPLSGSTIDKLLVRTSTGLIRQIDSTLVTSAGLTGTANTIPKFNSNGSGLTNSTIVEYAIGGGSDGSFSMGSGATASSTDTLAFGTNAGSGGTSNFNCILIGPSAGAGAINSNHNTFIGTSAGSVATSTFNAVYIGDNAGALANASQYSNFIGYKSGYQTSGSTYSNLIGYQAGMTFTNNKIGNNNIIIGTNLSLPSGTTNSINIGGVLFGTNTYSSTTGNPSISGQTIGRIGINIVNPVEVLDVSGYTRAVGFKTINGTSGQILTADGLILTGTTNIVPKYGIGSGLTNSNISDNGSAVTITTDAVIRTVSIGKGLNVNNLIFGQQALTGGSGSQLNTAIGDFTLKILTTGQYNTALAYASMNNNTTGSFNTALGSYSLFAHASSSANTAVGSLAMSSTSGISNDNVVVGYDAYYFGAGSRNTVVGTNALVGNQTTGVTGNNNIVLGFFAARNMASGSNNILIENNPAGQSPVPGGVTNGSFNIILNPRTFTGIAVGSGNTIIGGFNNNIPDGSNRVIIGDGSGNTRMTIDASGNTIYFGSLSANSFVKSGGTSTQYLMADGSVSTGATGNLFSAGTGLNSIVTKGSTNIASGELSFAQGEQTSALGEASHAEGYITTAFTQVTHAEGWGSFADGDGAHAEGYFTIADGQATHAEGWGSEATGFYSHAEGFNSVARGTAGHAEGYNTTAFTFPNYFGIHAEGQETFSAGRRSHAEGYQTQATGDSAHSEGEQTKALGHRSHAEGYFSIATGDTAHAEGTQCQANGSSSHAEGVFTKAWGGSSHSEGQTTVASGFASHAEGQLSIASGDTSHAEGYNTIAGGSYSHSEGRDTQSTGFYTHAEGNSTQATTDSAHAEGYQTRATGSYAHAEGWNTSGTSTASHAEGVNTLASGGPAHAEGWGTSATTLYAHAEGFNTLVSGQAGHAEGRSNRVTGNYSHAEGDNNLVNGIGAHVGGTGSTATGNYSFVHGSGSTASVAATNSIILGSNILAFGANRTYVNDMVNKRTMGIPTGSTHTALGEDGSFTFQGTNFYWRDGSTWYKLTGATGTW